MGWPKGVKRKKVEAMVAQEKDQEIQSVSIRVGASPFSLILGVRHLGKDAQFPGLWQLCVIDRDGNERTVVDATSHGSVISMAQNEIARCL